MKEIFNEASVLNMRDKKWLENYKYACLYYKKHGNLFVPSSYEIIKGNKVIKLGIWILTQRKSYFNKNMSNERIQMLDEIEMVWDVLDEKWEEMYKHAKLYYDNHENLLVPKDYYVRFYNEKINLDEWITRQKIYYKNNKLSKERKDKLDEINITLNDDIARWNEMYNYAKKYYDEHNNLLIPYSYIIKYDDKEINLGQWIARQRINYRINKLSKGRIEKLEQIKMKWDITLDKWDFMYDILLKYYNEHNNILIPCDYVYIDEDYNEIKLGAWLNMQKRLKRQRPSEVNNKKINMLDDLNMCWQYVDKGINEDKVISKTKK